MFRFPSIYRVDCIYYKVKQECTCVILFEQLGKVAILLSGNLSNIHDMCILLTFFFCLNLCRMNMGYRFCTTCTKVYVMQSAKSQWPQVTHLLLMLFVFIAFLLTWRMMMEVYSIWLGICPVSSTISTSLKPMGENYNVWPESFL